MPELLSANSAFAGINLVAVVALIILSAVAFICLSGFVKYSIILNIIKNAIGTQQIPPSIVVNLLASLMALNAIWPAIEPGIERVKPLFVTESKNEQSDLINIPVLAELNQRELDEREDIASVFDLTPEFELNFPELVGQAKEKTEALVAKIDIPFNFDDGSVWKYFLGSLIFDLYEGFEAGLKFYIVFVSIDFLVSLILTTSGMAMLSPTVISIPIKLAVFYYSPSWLILFRM